MLPHMFDGSFILHLNIHSPIAARCQGQIPLRLNHNLSIVINSRDSALREEEDALRVVTEVFVLFKKAHNFFVVHVAGHYVPFYHVQLCQFGLWVFAFCELHQSEQFSCEVFEQGEFGVQLDIEHTFRMIEAQPGTLASRHDTHANLPKRNTPKPNLIKLLLPLLNLLPIDHILKGFKLNLSMSSRVVLMMQVHILVQLVCLLEIQAVELGEEVFFQGGVLEMVVVVGQMGLPEGLSCLQNIFLHFKSQIKYSETFHGIDLQPYNISRSTQRMAIKVNSLKILQKLVKWLTKTQGRDKLCKLIQYFCLIMSYLNREDEYYSLQFQTLFRVESVKDARKLFRLFKSIIEYQKLIEILLDDQDGLLKVFRVLGQVCFFFYWFFDNISIVYKIKLFKGDFVKHNILASIFWLLSLVISVPVYAIQAKFHRDPKVARKSLLDFIKYSFDLLPATQDSTLLLRLFKLHIHPLLIGVGGFTSAAISTYQCIKEL